MKIEPIIIPERKIKKKKKIEEPEKIEKVKKEIEKPDLDLTPIPKKKEPEMVEIKRKPVKIKKKIEEKIIEEKNPKIKEELNEWRKGPKPSTYSPPEPQYAFEPTPEEKELMEKLKTEEMERTVLKPTPEEEELIEKIRDQDLIKEIPPSPEEIKYMKKFGVITEDKIKRIRTGIEGVDELTHGGLPRRKCISLIGGPGTGKSIFLMQYLVSGARDYGEPGIYITFEEEVEELKSNFANFNFEIEELERKGLLKIVHYNPMRIKRFIKNMDVTLRDLIKSMNAKRLVIDSLSAFTLLFENEGEQREGLFALFKTLKKLGVSSLLSNESWKEPSFTRSGIVEFISDGVIVLYNLKIGDTRVRALEILKMRGIKHEARIVPFKITENGIVVFTEEEVFGAKRE